MNFLIINNGWQDCDTLKIENVNSVQSIRIAIRNEGTASGMYLSRSEYLQIMQHGFKEFGFTDEEIRQSL